MRVREFRSQHPCVQRREQITPRRGVAPRVCVEHGNCTELGHNMLCRYSARDCAFEFHTGVQGLETEAGDVALGTASWLGQAHG